MADDYYTERKAEVVAKLLEAKKRSGKTFEEISQEVGLTNCYTVQLFFRQAQLKKDTAPLLKKAVPDLDNEVLWKMQEPPFRSYDEDILQEPNVYRIHEAVMHYGRTFTVLLQEKFGDGIMSAIDFFCTMDKIKGKHGEDRCLISFNGKFLPHTEQKLDMNTAPRPQKE
eukprot:SM000110S18933  [mRNA]  locus=s110:325631:327116:- [translate_table: standard]